jgi:sugar phosphate isomerase/epimerase
MKLSVSTYSLHRWRKEQNKTLEDTIDFIASTGVPGIEFSGMDEKAKADPIGRATELRARAEQRGLKVVSYCVGAELLVPMEKQKEVVEALKRDVDVAATFGVSSMRHDVTRGFSDNTAGLKISKTFSAVLKHVVPAIREVTEYAQSKGVKTSLENHGFYMQQSTRVEKLIKAVKHRNYGLTIDMGNFLCVNENPVNATKRLAKYAVMAHVKDFHIKKKELSPGTGWFNTPTTIALRGAIAGHGAIDIPAELRLLKRAKYKGYISLEFEGMEEPTKAVTLGLEYLRKHLDRSNGR